MRKYAEVFRWSFKMQIVWRFDVVMTMLAMVGRVVAAWFVWRAVFAGKVLVGGFTFESMLSYYVVASLLSSLDMSRQISEEVSHLIRGGGFSKHMVTPMSPFGFFSFMVAGEMAFHLAFICASVALCALLFGINVLFTASVAQALAAVAMALLGLLCMMCLHFLLGMLAFKFLSVGSFLYAAGSVAAFLTGSMVPLSLLPRWMTAVMRLFPFYYVTYLPSMLLTGQRGGEALTGLVTLACWTAGLLALNRFAYHRLRIRYDGVGI